MKIQSLSNNKKRVDPREGMRVPIVLNVSDSIMPCAKTLERLAAIASHDSVCSHVAALSDIHYKPRNECPTGTAIVTEDKIVPQFIDAGLNCGMRMIKTPLFDRDLPDSAVTALFRKMQERIPITAKNNVKLSHEEFFEIARKGAPYIIEKHGLDPEEAAFIEFGGNMFADEKVDDEDIRECIPDTFRNMSLARFGTLGKGNHFIELQKIEDIVDDEIARILGVEKNQIVVLMHTGSSALGNLASNFYAPRKMPPHRALFMFLERLRFYGLSFSVFGAEIDRLFRVLTNRQGFQALDEDSKDAVLFLRAMKAAHNFGYASRTRIMELIRKSFAETLGKPDFRMSLLYDMSHVSIFREEHFGKKVWVHRHGATRAFPSNRVNGHPVFGKTGEPVFVPGSMGDPTYLGVGHPENFDTYFSSSHGAGVADSGGKPLASDKETLTRKMHQRKVQLFKNGTENLSKIDPDRFKNIEIVVNGMRENKIIRLVAKLSPIAVMKG